VREPDRLGPVRVPRRPVTDVEDPLLAETSALVRPETLTKLLQEHFGTNDQVVITGRAQSGSSNVTAFITFGERRLVVRRPPAGDLLPTAHDMAREYKFLAALHGSVVPVARPILYRDDAGLIGAPFYVMERVEGYVLQQMIPDSLHDPENLRRLCVSAITTLAALHDLDRTGLDLPGRPDGYLQRQVARWSSQARLTPTATRLVGLDRLTEWVRSHIPEDVDATIVHGDYGLHNLLFGAGDNTVAAVMDWEMATLGDPLADLTWFLGGWVASPDGQSGNPANDVVSWPGALSQCEMYGLYTELTARKIANLDFYRAFNSWKGIVILEGLYSTYLNGHAANASVARFADTVPAQLQRTLTDLQI
jgi:aminoglycoside phosphotransferase (APT) family kinase protein